MRRCVVQRRGRDDSDRILERGQDVKGESKFIGRMSFCHGHSDRVDEPRAFSIGDQLIDFLCGHPLGLALRNLRACQTG